MTRIPRAFVCVLLVPLITAIAAKADSLVLTFEGLTSGTPVGNHYLQYGITFSNSGLASVSELDGGGGNYVPPPPPGITSLALIDGAETTPSALIMNVSGGFKSTFSFDYIAGIPGSVTLYSGLAGTGVDLGTIALPVTPACASGPTYCQWLNLNLDFSGTAKSAVFLDQHLYLVVDNIKLDTVSRTVVPEPTSLLLAATGIAGIFVRGRKFVTRG